MAGRTGLKTYQAITDFSCNQVLTNTDLNKLKDNIQSVRETGGSVFSQMGGMNNGYQRTLVGFAPTYTSAILTTYNEQASSIWFEELKARFVFENSGHDKYVLNLLFRALDSTSDADVRIDNSVLAEFTQVIKVNYVNGSGSTQQLFASDNTGYGSFTTFNAEHKPFLTGQINLPPTAGTSEQCELELIVENTAVGSSVGSLLDNQPIFIKDRTKWGGIASCSLRLYN